MASYVERIIDFLDKLVQNPDMPKMLTEDIEWAIDVISQNKLYTGSMDSINFNMLRPEIAAWIDMINMNSIPKNLEEIERLAKYEEMHRLENQKKGRKRPVADILAKEQSNSNQVKPFNPDESQAQLLNQTKDYS